MRIAVIGTGIAGNAAAWALSQRYPVTVYDRELRPGGHSHTVTVDYDGTPIAVDIGFIVSNEINYPELTAMFAHLGVETTASEMDFALTAKDRRFEWKGGGHTWLHTAKGLFAQPQPSIRAGSRTHFRALSVRPSPVRYSGIRSSETPWRHSGPAPYLVLRCVDGIRLS